jgi:hypothetical protein
VFESSAVNPCRRSRSNPPVGLRDYSKGGCPGEATFSVQNGENYGYCHEVHGCTSLLPSRWLHSTVVDVPKHVQNDTKLVSILYRNHKALQPSCKVSSLYAFDALARAARSHANKHKLSTKAEKGNCATFLQKLEGVLDSLVKDMIACENEEAKVR